MATISTVLKDFIAIAPIEWTSRYTPQFIRIDQLNQSYLTFLST